MFDRRFKILSCLDFGSSLSVEELFARSKIKDLDTFTYLLEDLAKHKYVQSTDERKVELYMYSSKRQYLADRRAKCILLFISVVSAIASVLAAVFAIVAVL